METPIITDKTVQIRHDHWNKFRNVRSKANEEYVNIKKRNAKKKKKENVPKYKIDEIIVLADNGMKAKHYYLAHIIDFNSGRWDVNYYAILLRTTDDNVLPRIGRIITFSEGMNMWNHNYCPARIKNEGIKWLII